MTTTKMQRDLQSAREENPYLTTLSRQVTQNVITSSSSSSLPPETKDANDDEDFSRALARRQARLDTATSTSGALTAELELKSANDRVAQLECQLLDAEETICHLKAEKLAAWREVERLRSANVDNCQALTPADFPQKQVVELEMRLAEQTQRLGAIRDHEHELTTLRVQLEETTRQYEELQQRHMELLTMDDEAVPLKSRLTSGETQCSIYGDEGDKDNATGIQPENDVVGRARAPADADTVNSKWQEDFSRHPTPHFDLKSPEVAYILRAWTKNMKKMRYLRRWLIQVANTKGPLPKDFPMGVELPRLLPEVRDGFLTLVLPLLRRQTQREILAHCRQYNDGIHTDLRFRIVPRE